MANTEDIVQRIAISGQNDVISALGDIGKAGEEAFKRLSEALGVGGEIFAGLITGLTGVGAALFEWSKHSSEAVHSQELLAAQTGSTVTDISAMQGALSSMGASTDNLGQAFRRLSNTIAREWEQITKEVKAGSDTVINDQLAVEKASLAAVKAQDTLSEAYGGKKDLHHEQLLKRTEATLGLAEAQQKLIESQKKQVNDQRNSIPVVAAAVDSIVKGQEDIASAGQKADLTVQNVIKGLVASASQESIDAIKNFSGSISGLVSLTPKARDVFYNLADFMHNAHDATLEQAVAMRFFGRGVGENLIFPLRQGSAALKEHEERLKSVGLVITDDMVKPAEEFHHAYASLSYDLATVVKQIGLVFAPDFTKGLKTFTEFFEDNHPAIVKWAESLEKQARPIIEGFANAVTGAFAALTGAKVDPTTDVGKWKKTFEDVGSSIHSLTDAITGLASAATKAFGGLTTIFGGFAALINSTFGTNLTKADVAFGAFASALIGRLNPVLGVLTSVYLLMDKITQANKTPASELLSTGGLNRGLFAEKESYIATEKREKKISSEEYETQNKKIISDKAELTKLISENNQTAIKEMRDRYRTELSSAGVIPKSKEEELSDIKTQAEEFGKSVAAAASREQTKGAESTSAPAASKEKVDAAGRPLSHVEVLRPGIGIAPPQLQGYDVLKSGEPATTPAATGQRSEVPLGAQVAQEHAQDKTLGALDQIAKNTQETVALLSEKVAKPTEVAKAEGKEESKAEPSRPVGGTAATILGAISDALVSSAAAAESHGPLRTQPTAPTAPVAPATPPATPTPAPKTVSAPRPAPGQTAASPAKPEEAAPTGKTIEAAKPGEAKTAEKPAKTATAEEPGASVTVLGTPLGGLAGVQPLGEPFKFPTAEKPGVVTVNRPNVGELPGLQSQEYKVPTRESPKPKVVTAPNVTEPFLPAATPLGGPVSPGQLPNAPEITGIRREPEWRTFLEDMQKRGTQPPALPPFASSATAKAEYQKVRDDLLKESAKQFDDYLKKGGSQTQGPYTGGKYGIAEGSGGLPASPAFSESLAKYYGGMDASGIGNLRRSRGDLNSNALFGQPGGSVDAYNERLDRRSMSAREVRRNREDEEEGRRDLKKTQVDRQRVREEADKADAARGTATAIGQSLPGDFGVRTGGEVAKKQLEFPFPFGSPEAVVRPGRFNQAVTRPQESHPTAPSSSLSFLPQRDRLQVVTPERTEAVGERAINQAADDFATHFVKASQTALSDVTGLITKPAASVLGSVFPGQSPGPQQSVTGEKALSVGERSINQSADNIVGQVARSFASPGIEFTKNLFAPASKPVAESAEVLGSHSINTAVDQLASALLTKVQQPVAPQSQSAVNKSAESEGTAAVNKIFDAIVEKATSAMAQLRSILSQPLQIQTAGDKGSQSTPDQRQGKAEGGIVNPVAGVSTVQFSGMAHGGIVNSTSSVQNVEANSFAGGGVITGAGGPKDDMVPIHASPGEYVVQAHAVQTYGVPFMHAINNETAPKSEKHAEGGMIDNSSHTQQTSSAHTETNKHAANYATGGMVGPITNIANRMADGGPVLPSLTQSSHSEIAIGRDGGSMGAVGRYAEGGDVQEKALPSGAQHFAGGVAHTVLGDSSVMQAIQNFTSGSVFGRMADTALPSESRLAFQQPARSEHPEKLGTVDMRTNFGDFQAQMNRNQVRDMSDKSTQAKLSRGGRRQSWYQG